MSLVQAYIRAKNTDDLDGKSWDFPKIHALQHIFDDIVAKGATRNYNSKTNESLNRPLKQKYTHTNFKDVAEQVDQAYTHSYYWLTVSQILNIDHLEYLVTYMRAKLDKLDRMNVEQDLEESDVGGQIDASLTTTTVSEGSSDGLSAHFHLGSPEKDEKALLDLTGATKVLVPNLLRMLGAFINKSRTRDEGYYQVQSGHIVSVFVLHLPVESQHKCMW
jgi:hypothetical protein